MNSERELFEEWDRCQTGWDLYWSDNINQYMDHQTNGAWLAWQASAQRQGYKLVPVDPTQKMIEAAIVERSKHGRTDSCIYKAMIGAVDD